MNDAIAGGSSPSALGVDWRAKTAPLLVASARLKPAPAPMRTTALRLEIAFPAARTSIADLPSLWRSGARSLTLRPSCSSRFTKPTMKESVNITYGSGLVCQDHIRYLLTFLCSCDDVLEEGLAT